MFIESKWQNDLTIYGTLFSTLIIAGNVHDIYLYNDNGYVVPTDSLNKYLHKVLIDKLGYDSVNFYNRVDGFSIDADTATYKSSRKTICEEMGEIRDAVKDGNSLSSTIIDLASLLCSESNSLTDAQMDLFATLFLASKESVKVYRNSDISRRNLIILVADKINDIPAWFYVNNPNVKTMIIPKPDKKTRMTFLSSIYDSKYMTEDEKKAYDNFVALTEDLSLKELDDIRMLAEQRDIPLNRIKEAIDLFKHGVYEKHWEESSLENAVEFFETRVKGQPVAIRHTVDVLQRV